MKKLTTWLLLSILAIYPSLITASDVSGYPSQETRKFKQYNLIPDDCEGYVEGIDKLDRYIKVVSVLGVDADIIRCLVSQKFNHSGLKDSKQVMRARQYVEDNVSMWADLLKRYDYDYEKFLEACKYGKTNIDYLYMRYGSEWNLHLSDIDIASGFEYISDTSYVSKEYNSFTQEVLYYGEAINNGR